MGDVHIEGPKAKMAKKWSRKGFWSYQNTRPKNFKNRKLQINLALNYGSKIELINAIKNLKKNNEKINERNLIKYLQTRNIPDPDLLIRTGDTKRLSNFLLWQLAYAEIFFEKKLCRDFTEKDYRNFRNV